MIQEKQFAIQNVDRVSCIIQLKDSKFVLGDTTGNLILVHFNIENNFIKVIQ